MLRYYVAFCEYLSFVAHLFILLNKYNFIRIFWTNLISFKILSKSDFLNFGRILHLHKTQFRSNSERIQIRSESERNWVLWRCKIRPKFDKILKKSDFIQNSEQIRTKFWKNLILFRILNKFGQNFEKNYFSTF